MSSFQELAITNLIVEGATDTTTSSSSYLAYSTKTLQLKFSIKRDNLSILNYWYAQDTLSISQLKIEASNGTETVAYSITPTNVSFTFPGKDEGATMEQSQYGIGTCYITLPTALILTKIEVKGQLTGSRGENSGEFGASWDLSKSLCKDIQNKGKSSNYEWNYSYYGVEVNDGVSFSRKVIIGGQQKAELLGYGSLNNKNEGTSSACHNGKIRIELPPLYHLGERIDIGSSSFSADSLKVENDWSNYNFSSIEQLYFQYFIADVSNAKITNGSLECSYTVSGVKIPIIISAEVPKKSLLPLMDFLGGKVRENLKLTCYTTTHEEERFVTYSTLSGSLTIDASSKDYAAFLGDEIFSKNDSKPKISQTNQEASEAYSADGYYEISDRQILFNSTSFIKGTEKFLANSDGKYQIIIPLHVKQDASTQYFQFEINQVDSESGIVYKIEEGAITCAADGAPTSDIEQLHQILNPSENLIIEADLEKIYDPTRQKYLSNLSEKTFTLEFIDPEATRTLALTEKDSSTLTEKDSSTLTSKNTISRTLSYEELGGNSENTEAIGIFVADPNKKPLFFQGLSLGRVQPIKISNVRLNNNILYYTVDDWGGDKPIDDYIYNYSSLSRTGKEYLILSFYKQDKTSLVFKIKILYEENENQSEINIQEENQSEVITFSINDISKARSYFYEGVEHFFDFSNLNLDFSETTFLKGEYYTSDMSSDKATEVTELQDNEKNEYIVIKNSSNSPTFSIREHGIIINGSPNKELDKVSSEDPSQGTYFLEINALSANDRIIIKFPNKVQGEIYYNESDKNIVLKGFKCVPNSNSNENLTSS